MTPDDQQAALDHARAGDPDALGRLLESFRPYVRLLARAARRGRVPHRLDDSDLVQDALAEAHKGFPAFAGGTAAEFAGWLRAVVARAAGHTLRGHLGTAKRDAAATAEFAALGTSPSGSAGPRGPSASCTPAPSAASGATSGYPDRRPSGRPNRR